MKRHKRMNRRMTDRLKSTVSVLLVSSMVLNPLSGIQTAIGSELNSTRVTVKGSKASINLSSAALREAASYAIQNGVTFTPEAYVGLDTATDAAFENILTQGSSLYELDLFDAEDQNVFTEAGINVKLLIQKDPKSADADLDTASASDLKRNTNVSFDYQAKNNRGKEILFYQKESALDSLIGNFMLEDIKHTELTEAETAEDNSTYELTGSETVTILYMNTDKDAHTFSLSVDGKAFSGSVKVEGNESAVSKLKKQLKKTAKEELTGTTEATAEVTEATIKAAETESSAKTENSATTESSAVAETSTVAESSAVTQDNVVASEAATKAEETTTAAETAETTITAAVKETKNSKKEAETQTAEVSQEETTAKETKAETSKAEKTEKAESVAEAVTKEVEQISGENTVTAIGAYTLQSFFEEGEAQEVKIVEETSKAAEEKIAESEKETEAETTKASKEETTAAETTAEAKAEKETTAAETTAVNKETTTAETTAENKESTAAAEATTAAETTAAESKVETAAAATEETKEPETKAITSMDESLAEERNKLLSEQTVADLAVNTVSAKAVQYTLDDLTSDFKSADLGAYLVKVYPVDKNAVDDSWTLKATELLKEEQTDADAKTENHETMKTETAAALKEAGIYDNSVSLDIHFEDAEGNKKEPNGKVRVEIEVAKDALDETATNLSVYHVEEKTDGSVKEVKALDTATTALDEAGETIADSKAIVTETVESTEAVAAVAEAEDETTTTAPETETVEKLSDEVAKVKVGFVTNSFSVYTIVANTGNNPIKVTIHHMDVDTKNRISGVNDTVATWYADEKETDYSGELKKALVSYKYKEGDFTIDEKSYKYYGSSLDDVTSDAAKKVANQWKKWCEAYVDSGTKAEGDNTLELNLYYQDQTTVDVVFKPTFFDYYVDKTNKSNSNYYDNGAWYNSTGNRKSKVANGYGSINSSTNYSGGNTTNRFAIGQNNDYSSYGSAKFNTWNMNQHNDGADRKQNHPIVGGLITGLAGDNYENVTFASGVYAPDLFSQYQYNSAADKRVAGKVIYENIGMTFQKTGDKYVYDETTDKSAPDGKGYDALGFFPLTSQRTNGAGQYSSEGGHGSVNAYFGMRFDAKFTIPADYNTSDLTFTFEGDDDMWVFVDGKTVLDLGGIHYPYPLGDPTYTPKQSISGRVDKKYPTGQLISYPNTVSFANYNDGKEHTLTVLYMERGGYDSHCHMEFVLPNLVPSDNVITTEDRYPVTLTKNVSGIENLENYSTSFSIYKATDVENGEVKEGIKAYKTATLNSFSKSSGSENVYATATSSVNLPDGDYVIIETPGTVDGYELTSVKAGNEDVTSTKACSVSVNGAGASATFTNEYQKTTKTVTVTKQWSGDGQPNDVSAVVGLKQTINGKESNVQKDGADWTQEVGYSDSTSGTSVSFEGLPVKDSSGNSITYTAKEVGIKVGNKTYTTNGNGVTIIKDDNKPIGYYTATTTTNSDGSVSITNTWTPVYGLTIEKTVTGTGASVDSNGYTFSLGITRADGTALTDADKATIASWNTSVMPNGYSDTVTVKPTAVGTAGKASVTITLPAGYKYQVKENKSNCENYTTTVADGDGKAIAKTDNATEKYTMMASAAILTENATVSFTNSYDIPTPAGIHRDILPYVISMGIALAGAALLLLENQRKRRLSR